MASVTVSRAGDRLIAVKQVPAAQARDIEREAQTLRRLDHRGVVRFVNVVETPDGGRALHTEFVSSDTWSTRPLTEPAERAAGVAALAEVVADLHDLGVAHGQVNPSHVLHGHDDRPVLCGLRLAAEATPENRRADLVAIADLCHHPGLDPGPLAGKLSALADAARAGRLSPRELARRLNLLQAKRPTAAQPVRDGRNGHGQHRSQRSRHRSLLVAAALLSAAAVLLAAGVWSRRGQTASTPTTITDANGAPTVATGSPTGSPDPTGPVPAAPTAAAAPGDPAGGATYPPPDSSTGGDAETGSATAPVPAASPASMLPGAPGPRRAVGPSTGSVSGPAASGSLLPPSPVPADPELHEGHETTPSGTVVEHRGSLYGIGVPGDFVRTGDWDCDGQPTPAIVRPSTGHVVLFDVWPGPGQSVSMPVRWEVDDPVGAEPVAHGDCDLLRVYTASGSKLLDPMESQ